MLRNILLASTFLLGSIALAHAADKYAVPPHPASGPQMCAIAFDTGYPKTTLNMATWDIEIKGKYNYDTTWQFKKLHVYLVYIPSNKQGPEYVVTDESTLGTKGSFSTTFGNVAPPEGKDIINVIARITIKKAGQIDKSDPTTAMIVPPKE